MKESSHNFFINKILFSFIVILIMTSSSCKRVVYVTNDDFEFYKNKYSIAVSHYSTPVDSLKLKALYFILHNLNDQFYYNADWIGAYNKEIENNNSIDNLVNKLDSLRHLYPIILNKHTDQQEITDTYLIENIDKAFYSIKNRWSKELSFSDFCEYILPYKIGNEKPENFRKFALIEPYLCKDSLSKLNNVFEATAYVNNHLAWFKGTLNYDYPIDDGYQISHKIATGSCYSTTRMALFQMRSIGLPVVIDFSPTWGNRSEGHYWNALMYKNKPFPFDPTGPNIGFYKIEFKGVNRMPYKISKVFRKTFAVQYNSLAALNDSNETIPLIFNDKRIKDVTSEYVPVANITLNYHKNINRKFAYLCTFNDQTWIPSFWGTINNQKIEFKDMARDIVYMPGLYLNESQLIPIGNPFILLQSGFSKELKANVKKLQSLTLTRKYPDDETNKIAPGDLYELLYWDNGWKSLGMKIAKEKKISFYNTPTNALFLLRDLTQGKQERIFTYENNTQIWW